jgi:hypothetical protein
MPVPGKQAGDETSFDFGFFANSKVMTLESAGLLNSFAAAESFHLLSRRS